MTDPATTSPGRPIESARSSFTPSKSSTGGDTTHSTSATRFDFTCVHIAIVSGVVAVGMVATAVVGVAAHSIAMARAGRRRDRWQRIVSLWGRPGRGLQSERPSFWSEALRSMGLSLVHWVVSVPVRRWVIHGVEPRKVLATPSPNRRAGPEA